MIDATAQHQLTARLKRIEGQVRGLQEMVAERAYCIDIITQVHAARKALEQVALLIMQQHMQTCVTEAIHKREGEQKIRELMATLNRFLR